jgi:hypothetical protein
MAEVHSASHNEGACSSASACRQAIHRLTASTGAIAGNTAHSATLASTTILDDTGEFSIVLFSNLVDQFHSVDL